MKGIALVVGLGKSGLSAARALRSLGAAFAVTDSRANPPGLAALQAECPEVPRYLGGFDPARLRQRRPVAGQSRRFGQDPGDCGSGGARRSSLGRH